MITGRIPIHRRADAFIMPATEADIAAVYGHGPDATVRAWALHWQGRVVGVAGIAANHVMFSNVVDDLPALLIAKAGKAFIRLASSVVRRPLVAFTDNPELLRWLGFTGPRLLDGRTAYIFDPKQFRDAA
jgi:xanthine dehydrogenase iron-sulfur cluster and FAD-binding subunit A